jgi:hypothetical protein
MTEIGMDTATQGLVLNDLQDFLQQSLVSAVKGMQEVPGDVKTVMTRALKGALDYVINDIHPEGQGEIDFFALLPEFGYQTGELLRESLKQFEFASEPLIEEVLGAVGEQFANTEGPDFEALVTLPGLVLMDSDQVGQLMGAVRDGIVAGTAKVVYDLAMEEKYQKAAIRALEDGMRHVAAQFEAYRAAGSGAVGGNGKDQGGKEGGFWEPPRFEEAVCCMPGMACWTGDFANAAGRAKLLEDIERLQGELVGVKERYDELNAENEREAADARALALADARDAAAKLVNRIADAEVRESKAQTAYDAAQASNDNEAIAAADAELKKAQAKTVELKKE